MIFTNTRLRLLFVVGLLCILLYLLFNQRQEKNYILNLVQLERNITIEPFAENGTKLSDSENQLEQNPSLLLPSNLSAAVPDPDDKKSKGKDAYEDSKLHAYYNPGGYYMFKKEEIEKVFGDELSKFPKLQLASGEESDSSWLSRFMVPLLWQTVKNQYDELGQMTTSISDIKSMLRSSNVKMIKINEELKKVGVGDMGKKRTEEFEFN